MFDTLDEQMKHDAEAESTRTERMIPWVFGIVATVVVLGGLYLAMRAMG
jgi:hypothetical protein